MEAYLTTRACCRWALLAAILTAGTGCERRVFPHAEASGGQRAAVPLPGERQQAVREAKDCSPGWPSLLGPDQDSISMETDVVTEWPDTGPPVRWSRPLGLGYSAPVVIDATLVLFYREGDEEVIEGADAETGRTRWTFRYPTAYRCPVNYSSGPYSTPVLEPNRVYAWGAEGQFHCLDLRRGTRLWARSLSDEYEVESGTFPVASSPLLEGDRLILNVGGRRAGAGIVALDKHTGRTLWTATQDGASCATPTSATMHDRRVAFVWTYDHLVALEPESGRVWWQIPFRANHPDTINAVSPIVCDDVVLVTGYQVGGLCVRVQPDGAYRELWRGRKDVLDSHYNNLICRDGCVYGFGAITSGLRCVELETGRLMWRWKSRLRSAASIAVGDWLILFDERARLASVRIQPEGYEPVSMTSRGILSGRCFSAPVLSGGLLYVRNEEELKCLDLSGPNRAAADHGRRLTQSQR